VSQLALFEDPVALGPVIPTTESRFPRPVKVEPVAPKAPDPQREATFGPFPGREWVHWEARIAGRWALGSGAFCGDLFVALTDSGEGPSYSESGRMERSFYFPQGTSLEEAARAIENDEATPAWIRP